MDASDSLVTVEPLMSATPSRPGPVLECGAAGIQPINAGKYTFIPNNALPEMRNTSSSSPSSGHQRPTNASTQRNDPVAHHPVLPVTDCGDCDSLSPKQHFLSIYYQNVRGLRTKTSRLQLGLSSSHYDVVILTETWLRSDICDAELSSDYSLFRCDRSEATSSLTRGGGVLVAVKATLHCTEVSIPHCSTLEQMVVCVKLSNRYLYLLGIYFRPNSETALYSNHTFAVQSLADRSSANDIVLLLGDYNLPHLQWGFDEDVNGYLPVNASSDPELVLIESISSYGLVQINSIPNINGRLLDLVFTNAPDNFEGQPPISPLLPVDPHHPPFELQIDMQSCVHISATTDSFDLDFRRCDFNSLNSVFSLVEWEVLLQDRTVDSATHMFYDTLFEIIHSKVPRRHRSINRNTRKPWWTAELRRLRNKLRKARKRFFIDKSNENRESLRIVETCYKDLVENSYRAYQQRLQSDMKRNPTAFWKFVREQRASNRVPQVVEYGNTTANLPDEVADLFRRFFQSVFKTELPQPGSGCFRNLPSHHIHLPFFNFTHEEVLRSLQKLDATKGTGVDDLAPILLKNCAPSLAFPLTILFNKSLEERTFPSLWKTAKMIPIYKSGSLRRVENYRGISILCCLGKLLESLIHTVLLSAAKSMISEFQHGFVPHRSTTSNLLCYTNVLFREVEHRN
ncbi:uncharacterized protein LOC129766903 [Toxorhynchites rutilus septentrionalis]|uniref:uncharacterized protein LOC129766903 n=1 Tax=Toxorhynchites rutilus septentrionalis TaxID=329112 RepID=UPI00247A342E|nr:uncharacterized protein LOC129766903 [Toxorhynchites rutilus septentrionalis]